MRLLQLQTPLGLDPVLLGVTKLGVLPDWLHYKDDWMAVGAALSACQPVLRRLSLCESSTGLGSDPLAEQ